MSIVTVAIIVGGFLNIPTQIELWGWVELKSKVLQIHITATLHIFPKKQQLLLKLGKKSTCTFFSGKLVS